MRVLTTGSRSWQGIWGESLINGVLMGVEVLSILLKSPLIIIHGDCPTGADAIVDRWARRRDYEPEVYPADWSQGKGAGHMRNQFMVNRGADLCIGFMKDGSRGTSDCLARAREAGIPTFTVPWEEPDGAATDLS